MDYRNALEILRLDRLEKRAEAHTKRGWETGNASLIARAARLQTAVGSKLTAEVMNEVAPYRDMKRGA